MGIFSLSKPNVERMKIKKDVKGLIKPLKHKDAEVWYLYTPLIAFCTAIFITDSGLIVGGY